MKEKTTVSQLISETIGVSNLLSRKQVYVTFSDEGEACTDGDTIVIPELSLDKQLNQKKSSIFRGLVDHESAHVRYTDFETLDVIKDKPSYIKLLLNVIEDIRIDKKISREYPGSSLNIDELYLDSINAMHKDFLEEKHDEKVSEDDRSLGILYVLLKGIEDRGINSHKLTELIKKIPNRIKEKLPNLNSQFNSLENTFDALNLAKNLSHLIGLKPHKLSKEEEEFIEQIIKFYEKYLFEVFASKGLLQEEESVEGEEEAKCDDDHKQDSKPNSEFVSENGVIPYKVLTTKFDSISKAKKSLKNRETKSSNFSNLLVSFKRFLETELFVGKEISEDGKKIDPKSLIRAFQGEDKVFQKPSLDKDLDTAILFAVDSSGSMSGAKIDIAFQAAYAMCRCLDPLNVSTKVTSFTTGLLSVSWGEWEKYIKKLGVNLSDKREWRLAPLFHLIHKDWSEPTFEKRYYFDNLVRQGNADGESILIFGRDLLNRPETKKIMIVLSDGYPQCTNGLDENTFLIQSLRQLEDEGLIIGSIGIQSTAPEQFYKYTETIEKINDLPKALSKLIEKLLRAQNDK
ncbi:MAG: hypothetical protein VX562_03295 [Pseudomonadota bacterium]|nr:hypothetical protein [Pseudomonadota bacterium]|tara:strand:- start:1119 stop:2834 length:1716 start_codon:yes stop_codon:yes gene_type:complete